MMNRLMAFSMALLMAASQAGAQAEKQLEAARHKEVVDGDLKAAAEQYRKIAAQYAKQPEVAARALYQLGQCQEKLGQAEARKSYERVVKEYGGAGQYAAQARARLAAIGGSEAVGVRTRLVWNDAIDTWGSVSADGRYLSFADWSLGGEAGVRDLLTGQNRRLTHKANPALGEAEASAISNDGRRVAFTWNRFDKGAQTDGNYELHVIEADGSGERVLLKGKENRYIEPHSWSPDNRVIAAAVGRGDATHVVLIPVDGSGAKMLPTRNMEWKWRITFSPEGTSLAYSAYADKSRRRTDLFLLPANKTGSEEVLLAENAIFMGWSPDGQGVFFTRSRNNENYLYFLPVREGRAAGEIVELKTGPLAGTLPLGITPQGTLIFGTHSRTIDGWIGEIDAATGKMGKVRMTFPVIDLGMGGTGASPRFSPDGKTVVYAVMRHALAIRQLDDGSERIIVPQMKGLGRVEWAHDGSALWIAGFGNDGQAGLYRVNTSTGAATLQFREDALLNFLPSRDGKSIYIRKPGQLLARDPEGGNEEVIYTGALSGINHMRLSHDGTRIALCGGKAAVVVDTVTGKTIELHRAPADAPGIFQGIEWSGDDKRILLSHRVFERQHELLSYPAEGGESVSAPMPAQFRGMQMSPDGRFLAGVFWRTHRQVWALENFLPVQTALKK